MQCPYCFNEISINQKTCPVCNSKLTGVFEKVDSPDTSKSDTVYKSDTTIVNTLNKDVTIDNKNEFQDGPQDKQVSGFNGTIHVLRRFLPFFCVFIIIVLIGCFTFFYIRYRKVNGMYNNAVSDYMIGIYNFDSELLDKSYEEFGKVIDYKDSVEYMNKISKEKEQMKKYEDATDYWKQENYEEALRIFYELGDYRDAETCINNICESLYSCGEDKVVEEDYEEARDILMIIPDYSKDAYNKAQELLKEIDEKEYSNKVDLEYQEAIDLYNSGDLFSAQQAFLNLKNDVDESKSYLKEIGEKIYDLAQDAYENGEYSDCYNALSYIDSKEEWEDYSDVITLKSTYEEEYKNSVKEIALQKLDDDGYSVFLEYVNSCVNDFFSQSEADSFLKEYEPKYLSEMTAFDNGVYDDDPTYPEKPTFIYNLSYQDNIVDEEGNVHNHCLTGGGSYIKYHLDGEYRTLSGTLFVMKDGAATVDHPSFICIKDGDGNELYRKSLYSGFGNESFSIDVSGVDDIEIVFSGLYNSLWGSEYEYGAVGELCLLK